MAAISSPPAYPRTPPAGLTPLQTHIAFFDMNDDGAVTPLEFAQGLKDLGMPGTTDTLLKITTPILTRQAGFVNDRLQAVAAPASVERATAQRIPISSIGYGKHDSDTDAFVDDTGGFDQARFDAAFARADRNHSGALGIAEIALSALFRAQSGPGFAASLGEHVLLWALGSDARETRAGGLLPDRRALSAELLKATLLGQGFYAIANTVASRR